MLHGMYAIKGRQKDVSSLEVMTWYSGYHHRLAQIPLTASRFFHHLFFCLLLLVYYFKLSYWSFLKEFAAHDSLCAGLSQLLFHLLLRDCNYRDKISV